MTNLLEQAIGCDDGDRAAKITKDALGIESDDVVKKVEGVLKFHNLPSEPVETRLRRGPYLLPHQLNMPPIRPPVSNALF